jgi:hypothetical protein
MKFYKTTEKLISENYPYGYSLRTTKTDYIEFDRKRGFRHCSYTINPKTGRQNNPKKSTYYKIMVLGKDESNNHTKSLAMDFYDHKDIDNIIKFFSDQEHFNLFTSEQMEYIYTMFLVWAKTSIKAQVIYCATKIEDLTPLFDEAVKTIVKGIKDKGSVNYFSQIKFDWDKIDALKVPGYQPFKVVSYGI